MTPMTYNNRKLTQYLRTVMNGTSVHPVHGGRTRISHKHRFPGSKTLETCIGGMFARRAPCALPFY